MQALSTRSVLFNFTSNVMQLTLILALTAPQAQRLLQLSRELSYGWRLCRSTFNWEKQPRLCSCCWTTPTTTSSILLLWVSFLRQGATSCM